MLLSVVLFCAVSVVAFFLIIKVIDFNEYKPRIQKAIKENTGYDLTIKGDIALSLSPVGVSIFDIEIKTPYVPSEPPFATLGSLDVAVEIAPLFHKEIKIKHVALDKLALNLEKDKEGKFNFELFDAKQSVDKKNKDQNKTVQKELDFPLVNIKKIKFSNTMVMFSDGAKGTKSGAENINLAIYDIHVDVAKQARLQGLFFKGDAQIGTLYYDTNRISELSTNLEMKDAMVMMDNLQYTLFDSLMQGSGKLDLSGKTPKISLKHKIAELKLTPLSKALFGKEVLEGNANGELKLSCSLGDMHMIKSTLSGFVHLAGENVTLKGYDFDAIVSSVQDPKNTNLVQLFSGTLGHANGTSSLLEHVVAKTDIGYSEASLSDVALSSAKHRVALKGALQIVDEKFLDVKVGVLNAKGCATFEQTITGKFKKPVLKIDENTINTIANVALSLVGKAKKTPTEQAKNDENCTPFYEGMVKHPETK